VRSIYELVPLYDGGDTVFWRWCHAESSWFPEPVRTLAGGRAGGIREMMNPPEGKKRPIGFVHGKKATKE